VDRCSLNIHSESALWQVHIDFSPSPFCSLSFRMFRSLLAVALTAVVFAFAVLAAPASVPVFYSWSATQNVTFLEAGYPKQYSNGVESWQLDSQYNRSSWFGNQGPNFVADYDAQLIYVIDYYRACQYTCSMSGIYAGDACDASQIDGSSLCTYDQQNRASYVGEEKLNGQMTDRWHWSDPLEGIDMADHDFWVSQGENPVAVQMFSDFHPFGTWEANVTIAYTDFTVPAPASAWNFTNEQYCYPGDDADCRFWTAKFKSHNRWARMINFANSKLTEKKHKPHHKKHHAHHKKH
jgi:membrane-bound metal-dependent hydrolase YbcI (DUF457 family)